MSIELITLVERLHRRFLDLVRLELQKNGIRDINAVQALVLSNIGHDEVLVRDLIERGYYLGQNVNYSIRKLVDFGYLDQQRDEHDKRSVRVKITDRGHEILPLIEMAVNMTDSNSDYGIHNFSGEELQELCGKLKQIERGWSEQVQYGYRKY
ncbi:MAG: MarR family transcriptional regulator [Alphaproteobacteria bacterium]|nr:MarR family transcriptional regulator [Alphaproteobacteria bacterium]